MSQTIIAVIIFLATYAIIVSERVHRTVAALAGAIILILSGVMTQEEAFLAIDFNVIFLLVGMMVIAHITSETGIFQWIAVQSVRAGHGNPFAILVILCLMTAAASSLLDNVTIVVLVAPITLFVAATLHVNPLPFLIAEILASNIGGAATLIGDPPNILIGSAADIDFLRFAWNMLPISLLALGVLIALLALRFWREFHTAVKAGTELDASSLITDRILLRKAVGVLALVLVGFMLHGLVGLEPATIALAGATLLLLISRSNPTKSLERVEWTSLFFFIGLFILVESLVKVGVIEAIASRILHLTGGSLRLTATALLWLSGLLSGIIDNIPYTATMIPLVKTLGQSMPIEPLWWALAMGADFGGNFTLVGASANLVVATVAERAGYPITFRCFLLYGLTTTAAVMVLSTLYLWARYLIW